MTFIAYGDPHGNYKPLRTAVADHAPTSLILLGDLDLVRPLQEELAASAPGVDAWWIAGNHDGDSPEWHDRLFLSAPDRNLNARFADLDGLRVGGLGGIFRERIWYPRFADEQPTYKSRDEMVRMMKHQERWRKGVPLKHRVSIWKDDYDRLAGLRLDVLVTHEAPTSHRHGFQAIDRLVKATGAKLVIHGHHHQSYAAELPGGIRVRGLGKAEAWKVEI